MTDQELIDNGTICRITYHDWDYSENKVPPGLLSLSHWPIPTKRTCSRCGLKQERQWRQVTG